MADSTDFTQSFDAHAWARAFVARVAANPTIATDEGTMIGWFANAIMRGFDEHASRNRTAIDCHADLLAALKGLAVEVSAAFGIAESEIRAALGNTNASLLYQRWEEAKAALAKAEGQEQP